MASSEQTPLSAELWVKVFALLEPADFAQVAAACRSWHHILRDEYLWKSAFIEQHAGGHANWITSDPVGSWRQEFIRRTRSKNLWSSGHQLACYRFKDLAADPGGVSALWLQHDCRALWVSSVGSLLRGAFVGYGSLRRSVWYYSRMYGAEATVTAVAISPAGQLALGLSDSRLVLYDKLPAGTLDRAVRVVSLLPGGNSQNGSGALSGEPTTSLPVQKIVWHSEGLLSVLLRRGSFPHSRLIAYDLPSDARIACQSGLDINEWDMGDQFGEVIFTMGGALQIADGPPFTCFETGITGFIRLDRWILVVSQSSSQIVAIKYPACGPLQGQRFQLNPGSEAGVTHLAVSSCHSFGVAADSAGMVYRITVHPSLEADDSCFLAIDR